MILASVIPYHHPRGPGHGRSPACIVRITDGARVLAEESIPVGRLACRDHGAYPCAACEAKPKARGAAGLHFERIVGPAELAEVVSRVCGRVIVTGAQAFRIEEPTGAGVEADRGRAIAAALRVALAGMESETPGAVDAPGSLPEEMGAPVRLQEAREPIPGYGAPLPAGVANQAQDTPALTPAQAPKLARRVVGIDPGARHVAATVVEELRVEGVGVIVEAGDLGAHSVAVSREVMLSAGAPHRRGNEPQDERAQVAHAAQPRTGETLAQARYVAHFTHKLGRDVPLARPKTIVPKDGRAPYTKTTRHEVTDEDVRGLIRELSGFLARHEVDEAVIETAAFAFDGAGAMLLRSNRIGGVIEGALIAAGLPVVSTSSKTWRAAAKKMAGARPRGGASDDDSRVEDVAGRLPGHGRGPEGARGEASRSGVHGGGHAVPSGVGPGQPGCVRLEDDGAHRPVHGTGVDQKSYVCDAGAVRASTGPRDHVAPVATWRAAVRVLIADLPTDLAADDREHILDAGGCALLALAPPPEVRPAPTRQRAPKGQGKPRGNEGRKARQERERAALECLGEVCRARGQRGHADECPIKVAQRLKVAEKMTGNQNRTGKRKGARA